MFGHCRGSVWRIDDFSRCFQQDYLEAIFPLVVCAGSLCYLLLQLAQVVRNSERYKQYRPLKDTRNHARGTRMPPEQDEQTEYSDEDTEGEDEFERNVELALHTTGTHESVVNVDKPRGEIWLVVIEEAAVLGQFGIHLAVLLTHAWGSKSTPAAVASLVIWGYVTVLASLRLLFSSSARFSFPRLWYHTAFIYGFLWMFETLLFRSAVIHPRSELAQNLEIANFAILTLLVFIAVSSRKGNKAVELEYEGDLAPSKEQVASVWSIATFGWVDAIVWKGYTKTLEMSDVWNLAPRDKAAALLSDYRQTKKTTILAWHLLRFFRRSIAIQAAWAALSGVFAFAPTLLLKAILEYVEDSSSTPANAAWFYVILLLISGLVSALADGQALWTGRKICIRIRAIIIGEIYQKALKRKASGTSEKVLGEEPKKYEKRPGLLKRVTTIGRKKTQKDKHNAPSSTETAEGQVSTGTIINLMAVDSFKVSEICAYLHLLWSSTPVQVIIAVTLLYRILGFSSIAGIGMMIFLLPINMLISKRFAAIQKQILRATDARIHTTNEILSNIRIIKYFAWEQRFMALVNEKRSVELLHLRRKYTWWAVAATIWSGSPILITLLSFLIYTVVEKKDLIPSIAFTALSLFQILRIPLDQLADMVAHVQESKVSVDRVEEFLGEEETDKYRQLQHGLTDESDEPVIGFDRGTFTWGSRDTHQKEATDAFRMMDLNLKFHVGQLNVIVGPTGCGKTSMLMALLGEMTKVEGAVYLPGGTSREDMKPDPTTGLTNSIAYCAQQAWLVNDTIKENIVFASPWDSRRYQDVLIACSLTRDLEILDAGDLTLVGEKGVTLSGGQKQRISLARALYSRARHVLLDDVLSAVDSHTAKWIFDQALLGPLMYNRTCLLVTHNVALCLPHSDFAVVIDNGRVVVQGTPGEVIDSGKLSEDLSKSRPVSRAASRIPSRVPSNVGGEETIDGLTHSKGANGHANGKTAGAGVSADAGKKHEHTEEKAEGGVKLSIILLYLKAMGPWYYWLAAAFVFTAVQMSSVATNVWIREWANAYVTEDFRASGVHRVPGVTHVNGISGVGSYFSSGTRVWNLPFYSTSQSREIATTSEGKPNVNAAYYLGVYGVLGFAYMVITLSRDAVLFGGSLAASRKVHQRLMESVTHAKFRFFDSTPLGQLMNRFSKDIQSVDQEIAPVAVGVVHCLASILTIVVLISVITPGFLIAAAFISILYVFIGMFYINSSRDLKRLESVQRSPLYQQFGETLSGMTTIRAYGDERRFIRDNLHKVNTHNRPFIYLWATNRWLGFRVDVVGALVSFFAGTFVVLSAGKIDAGAAGLAMTYAVTFTENMLWFVRLYASNEQNMNSVERIKEYLDVEQESQSIIPDNRPPGNWPSKGSVEFIGYSTRYRSDFDFVLKKITFRILSGEKVGVVGRTGAGKSSLALALFRALEAEEGKILIDEVDIGLIGLQDLRESIVMVPQDPTLFTGTVRSNLDPFGLFTDEEIFTVLRGVQLIGPATSTATTPSRPGTPQPDFTAAVAGSSSSVGSSPLNSNSSTAKSSDSIYATLVSAPPTTDILTSENKNIFRNLASPVAESGSNLSQGQRQLLCLARALLKNPKVLLMDEATASIDYATDAKIQGTIREIKNTTITIAHRLQTIIDYDKVLVLDKGEVVEFGDPWDLIEKEKGIFRGMCEMSGDLEMLRKEAKKAFEAKRLINDS